MPSPFPGMDPYLENPVWWPDFHHSFITYMRDAMQPDLRPKYRARIGERVYIVEPPQHLYPDIVLLSRAQKSEPPTDGGNSFRIAAAPADSPLVLKMPDEERTQGFIEIFHADGTVVTTVEVLSPVNKTSPRGLNKYLEKQKQLILSDTHLLEIDLLRSGTHAVAAPSEDIVQQCAVWNYLACVRRASMGYHFEVYPTTIRTRLPRISVPLRAPDPDIVLDLQAVFTRCYDSGGYEDFVDYTAEPAVPLTPDEAAWASVLLHEAGRRTTS